MSSSREFICPECSRSYKAQESLNRHRKNHSQEATYVCEVCNGGFFRRDLLMRHSKIHENGPTKSQPKSRQRIRRACRRCSKLKTKCDSLRPCTSCSRSQSECIFEGRGDRGIQLNAASPHIEEPSATTSPAGQLSSYETNDTSSNILTDEDAISQHERPNATPGSLDYQRTQAPPLPDRMSTQTIDGNSSNMHPQWNGTQGVNHFQNGFNGFNDASIWSSVNLIDNATWPWLHETMFFQEGPGVNMHFPVVPLLSPEIDNGLYATPGSTRSLDRPDINEVVRIELERKRQYDEEPRNPHPQEAHSANRHSASQNSRLEPVRHHSGISDGSSRQKQPREEGLASDLSKNSMKFQTKLVEDSTKFAFNPSKSLPDRPTMSAYWRDISSKVEKAFDLKDWFQSQAVETHMLHRFVDLYFENFSSLWILIWRKNLVYDDLPPYLYLTLASIGSIYGGEKPARYGFQMQESIRLQLIAAPFQRSQREDPCEPLLQSMLLIQVAALYFGHRQVYSVAQQLGSILVAQARKFNLFNEGLATNMQLREEDWRGPMRNETLARWIKTETRKRLALGIFRTEVFVSHLLNTRPLVSYEEMNIELPCALVIWDMNADDLIQHILSLDVYQRERRENLISDLVRIAFDRHEDLPNLRLTDFETVLFGLQQMVWSFSHDFDFMTRLTGENPAENTYDYQNDLFGGWSFASKGLKAEASSPEQMDTDNNQPLRRDPLEGSVRRMQDLRTDYGRTILAFRKWKRSFAASFAMVRGVSERSTLLATRLLYHLSFIRLNADVQSLHQLAFQLANGRSRSPEAVRKIHHWCTSLQSRVALDHACAVWLLIQRETEREVSGRARFNILSHIALHHAASVVWAFAGTHEAPSGAALDMAETGGASPNAAWRIHRKNNTQLMNSFSNLLMQMAPSWIRQSSFRASASYMANFAFPSLDSLRYSGSR